MLLAANMATLMMATMAAATTMAHGKLPCAHADAFSSVPYAGNPACVVLLDPDNPVSDEWMQKVALEMHLSETAFLMPRSDSSFDLRWFTPTDEVDLCGHATLASAHVLWEVHNCPKDTPLEFYSRSGKLTASRDSAGWIELDFPSAPDNSVSDDAELRAQLLLAFPNLQASDVLYVGRNQIGGPGGGDLLVEVTPAAFATLEYVTSEVERCVCRVLSVTAAGCPCDPDPSRTKGDYDFSSRGFAPCVGVAEDPV